MIGLDIFLLEISVIEPYIWIIALITCGFIEEHGYHNTLRGVYFVFNRENEEGNLLVVLSKNPAG